MSLARYYPRVCTSLERLSLANGHCAPREMCAQAHLRFDGNLPRCITDLMSLSSSSSLSPSLSPSLPSLHLSPCHWPLCAQRYPSEIYFRLVVRWFNYSPSAPSFNHPRCSRPARTCRTHPALEVLRPSLSSLSLSLSLSMYLPSPTPLSFSFTTENY